MITRINANIERRLLVNWRADPDLIASLLPVPFRPQLIGGYAVVGICFVRLGQLRPRGIPGRFGLRCESAAHRIAVERETPDGVEPSVFVLQRVTDSRGAVLAGGRLFPGVHTHASFHVYETGDQLDISLAAANGQHDASVSVRTAEALDSRLFASLDDVSTFFRDASVGWSANRDRPLEGVELASRRWMMTPVRLQHLRSGYFDDTHRFPPGSIQVDSAVIMHDLPVSWRSVDASARPDPGSAGRPRVQLPRQCLRPVPQFREGRPKCPGPPNVPVAGAGLDLGRLALSPQASARPGGAPAPASGRGQSRAGRAHRSGLLGPAQHRRDEGRHLL